VVVVTGIVVVVLVVVTGVSASPAPFFGAVDVFLDALNASNLALPRFAAALVIDSEENSPSSRLYPSRGRSDVRRSVVVTASTSEDFYLS